jgi:hypothetical protein
MHDMSLLVFMQVRPEYMSTAPDGSNTRLLDMAWVDQLVADFHPPIAGTAKAYILTESLKLGTPLYELFVKTCEKAGLSPDKKSIECWNSFRREFRKALQTVDHLGSIDIWLIAGKTT